MANSTFNMSRFGGRGNQGSECTGWSQITADDGNEISVVSNTSLLEALRKLQNIQPTVNQVADYVYLKYDCPKVGDAVFWNARKNGYDIASAEIDSTNIANTEHQIESLGVVEEVTVPCSENQDIPSDGYLAKVVFYGKISFPEESTQLFPGIVYYLSDSIVQPLVPSHFKIGSNVIHGNFEPVISKPVFVATGTHTAVVTNYRPLTGSPTGGKSLEEDYQMTVIPKEYYDADGNPLETGWQITVENVGVIESRNQMFLQFEYNKLEGPQPPASEILNPSEPELYYHFEDIGILYTQAQESVNSDKNIVSRKVINFTPSNGPSYLTGIGELRVRLKIFTQSTANINDSDRLNSPEVLLTNESENTISKIIPTLNWNSSCLDEEDPNVKNLFIDNTGETTTTTNNQNDEFGVVFGINLTESTPNAVGTDEQPSFKVPMTSPIGFEVVEMINQNDDVTNPNFDKINGNFKLTTPLQESIEIIPVANEETIVEKFLRIRATTINGDELPATHWASIYGEEQIRTLCSARDCCYGRVSFTPSAENSTVKQITTILENDSSLLDNKVDAKFFTKPLDQNSFGSSETDGNLSISWKNCRENTRFCYPQVPSGTKPSFMTIYANEARTFSDNNEIRNSSKITDHSKNYDPRYTLMEIGSQDTLDGEIVRLIVNTGSTTNKPETCFTFTFDGSLIGKHFTIQELEVLQPTFEKEIIST